MRLSSPLPPDGRYRKAVCHAIAVFCFALLAGAEPTEHCALLIANSDYGKHTLPSVKQDAAILAKALERAGFAVTLKENVNNSLRQDLEGFSTRVPTGGVAFYYFAGFASRYDRKIGKTVIRDDGTKEKVYTYEKSNGFVLAAPKVGNFDLRDLFIRIRDKSRARLNLIFFDCGQRNPLAKPEQQGLAEIHPNQFSGGLICFAAPPGQVLPDGMTSTLAAALANQLGHGQQPLGDLVQRVEAEVSKASRGRQRLWTQFGLDHDRVMPLVRSESSRVLTNAVPPANPKPGDCWRNGIGMTFCWIPPGSFRMGLTDAGSPETRDAKPVTVHLTDGIWMSKYETTFGDYARARGKDPLGKFSFKAANLPINGFDANSARSWGNSHLLKAETRSGHLPKGWEYRLPTEAEWEYACRAGGSTRFGFGDDSDQLHLYANTADACLRREDGDFYYGETQRDDGVGPRPAPAGSYRPNAWGLHDMHGNVSEFTLDAYLPTLPGGMDPIGRLKDGGNGGAVYRGGSWCSTATYCQAGFRHHTNGKESFRYLGFRVVLARSKIN